MSTSIDRRRPGIWSYISFGSGARRRSISLPQREKSEDAFEKEGRYFQARQRPTLSSGMMGQSQRSRYLKTGGVVAFVVLVLFYLSGPRGSSGLYDTECLI